MTEDGKPATTTVKSSPARIVKWDETKVPLPVIPNVNYASFILKSFHQRGEEEALIDAVTEKSYSYGDLCRMILSLRNGLAAAGVEFGDAVILVSYNHVDVPVAVLAIMLLGAICVPTSPALTKEELAHIVTVSEAKWAVAHQNVAETVEGAFESVAPGSLKQLWNLGGISKTRPNLSQLMVSFPPEPHPMDEKFDSSTTVALMPFSTGTTGLPKGVMLSHRNLLVNLVQNEFARRLNPNRKINLYERVLLVLPMYHIYGFNSMVNAFFNGGKLILLPRFSPERYFRAIEKYKVTFTPIVPYIIKRILETPSMKDYDLSSLIGFGSGSAPVSGTTMESLAKKSGKFALQGWAMTETSGIATVTRGNMKFKPDSVGVPHPFFQMKVVDVESGRLLGEREEGEICVKGPAIMLGYANNPKATAETVDSDGWLHSGDIGYYDEDNYFYITDRIKDLIKVKGYQVSPSELENIIKEVEGVNDVAVAGVPHESLGEAPRAWIVPNEGATIDINALIKHVEDRVAPYKRLKGGVDFVKSIPRNHLHKIMRRELQNTYKPPRSKL